MQKRKNMIIIEFELSLSYYLPTNNDFELDSTLRLDEKGNRQIMKLK